MQIGAVHQNFSAMQMSIASLSSFIASVKPFDHLIEFIDCKLARRTGDKTVLLDNLGNLIVGELVGNPAIRAGESQRLQIKPTDRHIKLCAALASNRDNCTVRVCHGWPILETKAE
jgi:hypothetical protein